MARTTTLKKWLAAGWSRKAELQTAGAVSRAVAEGADRDAMLACAAQSLLTVSRADRAGVWIFGGESPQELRGCVLNASGAAAPDQWRRLEASDGTVQALLRAEHLVPFAQHQDRHEQRPAAVAGMHAGVWLPLLLAGRAAGLALVAYEKSPPRSRSFGTRPDLLTPLAAEIAVAAAALAQPREAAPCAPAPGLTEAGLLGALESVDTGVALYDAAGRVRYASRQFARLAGVEESAVAACKTFEELVALLAPRFRHPDEFARRWRDAVEDAAGEEAVWDELDLLSPHDSRHVLERCVRPVAEPGSGGPLGWLETYRDVTGERMLNSKLVQTEKLAALGQLVSGMAHELNNPLASIMGYAQLLLARTDPEAPGRTEVERIYQEAERSVRIVKNLLLFARDKKPGTPALRDEAGLVDLNELVERTLALRSYELRIENISVGLHLAPELPLVAGDPHRLQQAILNLLVNAEQAIQSGGAEGRIHIRTLFENRNSKLENRSPRPPGQPPAGPERRHSVVLEITDDGPGVPPEVASRVFDPFFTTKPVGVGTGLGLSIVYGIVHEHGGEITLAPPGGQEQGACFRIELPAAEAPPDAQALSQHPSEVPWKTLARLPAAWDMPPAPASAPALRRRILVVEDEATVAQLIADVLGEEGLCADVALDAQEGLNRLAREHYDLVVCDLRMPRLDGRAFYETLVRARHPARERIVYITGDTLTPRSMKFLEQHRLPYLAKPFLVEELKLLVGQALARAGPNRAPASRRSAKSNGSREKDAARPPDRAPRPRHGRYDGAAAEAGRRRA